MIVLLSEYDDVVFLSVLYNFINFHFDQNKAIFVKTGTENEKRHFDNKME